MSAIRQKPVDVAVVGMGVAGTILAKELAACGLRVVGFERGRMIDPKVDFATPGTHDELRYERFSDLQQNLSRDTITFRNDLSQRALPMREIGSFKLGECVGGAGVTWGAMAMRFLPWDFKVKSATLERYGASRFPQDCTSQDWGLTYDELEPYYDQFEELYGVSGKAGNLEGEIQPCGNQFEGWRTRDYPNPPRPETLTGRTFRSAAESLGYRPYTKPAAGMSQTYRNPHRLTLGECAQGGYCHSHGCSMDAKASPLTTVVPALMREANFEMRTRCTVTRITYDHDAKRATGVVYYDAAGRECEQPAEIVILASYVFSNTRLLLLSGIGTPYDPRTGRGAVGKNYTYQSVGSLQLFFEDRAFNRFIGGGAAGVAIDDFNGDNFDHTGLDFIGGATISANSPGALPIKSHPTPKGTPTWGSAWKQAVAKYYDRTMGISVTGGSQAYRYNYLDLDPTYRDAYGLPLLRKTFDWPENDRQMIRHISQKALGIARVLNPESISARGLDGPYSIVPYQSTHNTGGAVMGDDPETSVVNKFAQCWDAPNVFVIGASAFPQNSANNPTVTVGALAFFAADAIRETYLKRPALLV